MFFCFLGHSTRRPLVAKISGKPQDFVGEFEISEVILLAVHSVGPVADGVGRVEDGLGRTRHLERLAHRADVVDGRARVARDGVQTVRLQAARKRIHDRNLAEFTLKIHLALACVPPAAAVVNACGAIETLVAIFAAEFRGAGFTCEGRRAGAFEGVEGEGLAGAAVEAGERGAGLRCKHLAPRTCEAARTDAFQTRLAFVYTFASVQAGIRDTWTGLNPASWTLESYLASALEPALSLFLAVARVLAWIWFADGDEDFA